MRTALAALALCLAGSGALRAQEEVPFVTTPDNVTLSMLQLAQVGPKDFVLDLGSGDGRIVILAAKRFGARGLGVEIVPELVQRSRRNAARAGVAERAKFLEQDLFKTDLSVATVITMYLLPEVNLQLRPALLALQPGTRIVSHDWDLGDWKSDRAITVDAPDKTVGLASSAVCVCGWCRLTWKACGAAPAPKHGTRLRLAQRFQDFVGTFTMDGISQELAGRIDGARLRAASNFEAAVDGARLHIDTSLVSCRRCFRALASNAVPLEGAASARARVAQGALTHSACKLAQAGLRAKLHPRRASLVAVGCGKQLGLRSAGPCCGTPSPCAHLLSLSVGSSLVAEHAVPAARARATAR